MARYQDGSCCRRSLLHFLVSTQVWSITLTTLPTYIDKQLPSYSGNTKTLRQKKGQIKLTQLKCTREERRLLLHTPSLFAAYWYSACDVWVRIEKKSYRFRGLLEEIEKKRISPPPPFFLLGVVPWERDGCLFLFEQAGAICPTCRLSLRVPTTTRPPHWGPCMLVTLLRQTTLWPPWRKRRIFLSLFLAKDHRPYS